MSGYPGVDDSGSLAAPFVEELARRTIDSLDNGKRIGLIGCGLWGRNILRDLCRLGAEVHVVETDASRRAQAEASGARSVLDRADALSEVDGLVVATPATSHAEVIEALAPRGVPIFTEKPFTTELASAERLARTLPDRLFVMHVWRYHRGVEMLGELARSGELGPVEWLRTTRTNWTSPRKDIDPLWTLAPHDLSIALEVLGEIPEPRYARAEIGPVGPCALLGVLGERPSLVLEVSTRYGDKRREVRLHCRDGVARLVDGDVDYVEILRSKPDGDLACEIERRRFSAEPPLLLELRTFLAHLAGGPAPRSSAAEGLASVAAMIRLRELAGL